MTPRTLLLLFALATLAVAPAARAETATDSSAVTQARTHFNRGADFFKEGNYQAALIEFKRANELAPNYRILYNLAQTYEELHDYVGALRTFERYLDGGGTEIAADRRAEVEAEIRKLHGRVARVTVVANVADADVLVDDAVVAKTPLREPLLLSAGSHRVVLVKGGKEVAARTLDLAGGDEVQLDLKAKMESPTSTPVLETSPPAPAVGAAPSHGLGGAFWVGFATTGALLVGTTVTGVLALDARSDYRSRLDAYPVSRADVDAARDRTKRLALVTDILGGATLIAGVATIYLGLSGGGRAEPRPAPSVGLVVGPGSIGIQGAF